MLTGHHVGVGVECECDGVVAEAVGDDLGVDASGEEVGGVGVAEAVDADALHLVAEVPDGRREVLADVVGVEVGAVVVGEDEIGVGPLVTDDGSELGLPAGLVAEAVDSTGVDADRSS
jgi:hypothetical protein